MLRNLYSGVFVHRGGAAAKDRFRARHPTFLELVQRHEPTPTDEDARVALTDAEYHEGLTRFGRELEEIPGPVWRERYQRGQGTPPAPMKRH